MLYAFVYGAILALGLILPLGAQNLFIFMQGARQKHFLHAMPTVLTAICCDTILIVCAVLGVSVVVFTIPWLKTTILLLGFVFLLYIGWISWHSAASKLNIDKIPLSTKKQIMFTASVSLLNPHALLDTIGVIGTNSLSFVGNTKVVFTLACILISACWFFTLSVMGHCLHKLDRKGSLLQIINKLSAIIVWSIAMYIGWLLMH